MSRINVVPVLELTDRHLLSEYRELPRVSVLAWKYYISWIERCSSDIRPSLVDGILPFNYTLGTGHVKFFYNKGEFLRRRFEDEIVPEMKRRGFKTNFTTYRMHPDGMNGDYMPTNEAIEINRQRINERLGGKDK